MATYVLKIFARYPTPGKAKSRLIPALGPDGAANLHARMVLHTLTTARRFNRRRESVIVELCHEGASRQEMERWLGQGLIYIPQGDGDLGRRMERQFAGELGPALHAFRNSVVVIGTDCPGITPHLLNEAFRSLRQHDLVLGPASDGGYYLIGMKRSFPELFQGIDWGTERVLNQTMAIAERLGLSVHCLATLDDVDHPEDLPAWEAAHKLNLNPRTNPRISIVIPALNEAAFLPKTLLSFEPEFLVEAIVVDGGSHDGTPDIAATCGARVLRSPPGRAVQMNAGAAAARASTLLFLHADTCLPPRFDTLALRALDRPGVVAGAFSLRIAGRQTNRNLRLIDRAATLRSRYLQMPYGDQGLFMRTNTFRMLNGFPDVLILEDYLLVTALKRRGRIVTIPHAVETSPRRWRQQGPWLTTLQNQLVILACHLGVSPASLARWTGRAARDRR